MEQSKAAYKECLTAHPSEPSQCAAAKAVYEADMQAYVATTNALRPGTTIGLESSGVPQQ